MSARSNKVSPAPVPTKSANLESVHDDKGAGAQAGGAQSEAWPGGDATGQNTQSHGRLPPMAHHSPSLPTFVPPQKRIGAHHQNTAPPQAKLNKHYGSTSAMPPSGWQTNFGHGDRGMYSRALDMTKKRRSLNASDGIGEAAVLDAVNSEVEEDRGRLLNSSQSIGAGPFSSASQGARSESVAPSTCSRILRLPTLDRIRRVLKSKSGGCVLDPRHSGMMIWDFILTAVVLYTAVVVPYEVAFLKFEDMETYLQSPFFWLNRLLDTVYLADIALTFMTMYFDQDKQIWITSPKRIANHYMRTWLIPDSLTMIPFDVVMLPLASLTEMQNPQLIKLLRLLKLLRLSKGSELATRIQEGAAIDLSLLEVSKYLGLLLIITHWLACMFGFLLTVASDINWAKLYFDEFEMQAYQYNSDEKQRLGCVAAQDLGDGVCFSPFSLYIAALYWSAMTVTTIGYGDIVPTNQLEQIVVIFAMLLGGLLFGYIVGVFAGLIANQNQEKKRCQDELRDLNALVKESHIPSNQAKEMRAFFRFLHVSRAMSMSAHQHLLARMSPKMRGQVSRQTDKGWVERLPYFKNVPESFVVDLVQALEYQAFPPGETVFKYGDDNFQMYVVKKGIVYYGGRVLLPGGTFCEESLYKPGTQGRTAVTLTYTYLYTLSRGVAQQIVRGYPEVERQFRLMGIRRLFREEVCSYAYAVQALFDSALLSAVDPQQGEGGLTRMDSVFMGLSQARQPQVDKGKSVFGAAFQTTAPAEVQRDPSRVRLPKPDSGPAGTVHIHPLWGHLNAMRVQHYYNKLALIYKVERDEAAKVDRSVTVIQKIIRGWQVRKDMVRVKEDLEAEKQRRMLLSIPSMVKQLGGHLEALQKEMGKAKSRNSVHGTQAPPADGTDNSEAVASSSSVIPEPQRASEANSHPGELAQKISMLQVQLDRQDRMLASVLSLLGSRTDFTQGPAKH